MVRWISRLPLRQLRRTAVEDERTAPAVQDEDVLTRVDTRVASPLESVFIVAVEERPEPRLDLLDVERLRDVVVRTCLQRMDHVLNTVTALMITMARPPGDEPAG